MSEFPGKDLVFYLNYNNIRIIKFQQKQIWKSDIFMLIKTKLN